MSNTHAIVVVALLAGAIRLCLVSFTDVNTAMTSRHLCTLGRVRDAGLGVVWFLIAQMLIWIAVWPFWPAGCVATLVITFAYIMVTINRLERWRHEQSIIARAKRMRQAPNKALPRKPPAEQ